MVSRDVRQSTYDDAFRMAAVVILLTLPWSVGCSEGQSASVAPLSNSASSPGMPPEPAAFDEPLLAIAQKYLNFRLVDPAANWAPTFCAPPPPPPAALLSNSDDPATHGDKIYYLFAKHGPAYLKANQEPSPVGQAVVKEAWSTVAADGPTQPEFVDHASGQHVRPFAVKQNRYYHAQEKSALFVMLKLEPDTPDTDNGWVYGTLTPDGTQVTSAGRLANCMGCHSHGTKDRLFGLPQAYKPN